MTAPTRLPNRCRGDIRGLCLPLLAALSPAQGGEPVRICATTPDLASIATAVLGSAAEVVSFTRNEEDPHFLEARPSMVRKLHDADYLLEVGLELEAGWLPVLVGQARNSRVLPMGPGRIVAGASVAKLNVPSGPVDRSGGDIHVLGNPHFLLDPVCGLQVAATLRDRIAAERPALAASVAAGFAALRQRVAAAMVGPELAALYGNDAEKLGVLFEHGRLVELLRQQGDADKLGGWFAALLPGRGAKVVAEHDVFPYFARRFGIRVVAFLEPLPGVSPTSSHLEEVVGTIRRDDVAAILGLPYYAPQHAAFVARATGVPVVEVAHQTGARPGCEDWVATIDYNVRALARVLSDRR